jgi:hypothetical protein
VIDLSELGSSAARRRFMAAFAEALYETNEEPLHLVLDEADLWAPQRPIKGWESLLGRIEEIVRRGRVRGFIPWLITQRPAVVHKDVLSQADILIAMKLTASQDRDAIGAWIEGQADRQEGRRILGDLPRPWCGEGYLWAPGRGILDCIAFPPIRTFDSSRTPKRGERLTAPRTLAAVDLTAITAALDGEGGKNRDEGNLRSIIIVYAVTMLASPSLAADASTHHIVLQVSRDDPGLMNTALSSAQNAIKYYTGKGESVQIEIVAYGPGLTMLREDASPVKNRIKQLKASKEGADLRFPRATTRR